MHWLVTYIYDGMECDAVVLAQTKDAASEYVMDNFDAQSVEKVEEWKG